MIRRPFCIIQRGKPKSVMLAEAVSRGAGGCRIAYEEEAAGLRDDETPVIIGLWPSTARFLWQYHDEKRPFVTLDNGYFMPYKSGGFFRATTNALQWIHKVRKGVDSVAAKRRYQGVGPDLMPWRKPQEGTHILVVEQSPRWMEMLHAQGWADHTCNVIRAVTDRPIIRRFKPLKGTPPQPTLEEHFENAHAVVGYSSNVLVEAAVRGIPVFPTHDCAASALGGNELFRLEEPFHAPWREGAMYQLAANQWNESEISSGRMWRELSDRYEDFFPALA